MELKELMERAAKIGLLIEHVHPSGKAAQDARQPYTLRDARDYYGNQYLYGASLERVAGEISKLEMRRAEERAAGIGKLHERAAKLKLLLKDTEPPDMDLDEDLRGPYVLANLDPVEGKGVGYYHAHFPGVSLKFIEEQLTQIEAEGPNGP
jgi:hypothetical protein